jgi:HEAT repeat protein
MGRWFLLFLAVTAFAAGPGDTGWEILTAGASEQDPLKRAKAVTALGTIRLARAGKLVESAMSDQDARVRLAAVSAMAERKSAFRSRLRMALDDPAGEVSFTAAKALWEMGDRAGKDLLLDVLGGESTNSEGFFTATIRDAKRTLRSPKSLVWIGAKQGAGFLFGPLGFGLGLVEDMMKDEGAAARALSVSLLAQDRGARDDIVGALGDKSPLVRITALKALGGTGDATLTAKLEPLMKDEADAVRYMAAASVVRLAYRSR